MILTDRFVFIHVAKTGGTCVTEVLRRIHEARRRRTLVGRLTARFRGPALAELRKHGHCAEIPPSHRGLPIVSCMRNPWSLLVSNYEYAWWKAHPEQWTWVDWDRVKAEYPRFPDLTFPEYARMAIEHLPYFRDSPLPPAERLGHLTVQFLRYYCLDPEGTFRSLDGEAVRGADLGPRMHPVRFLRMESLNAGLHGFLLEHGYDPEEIAFVRGMEPVIPGGPGPRPSRPWREHYDEDLLRFVRHRERLLFRLFPGYDGTAEAGEPAVAGRGAGVPPG